MTMTTQAARSSALDARTAEQLSLAFNRVFETLQPDGDLFTADVFFDLNMPAWRFQMQGQKAFTTQLKQISQGKSRVEIVRTVATVSGFVTEHVEHQDVNGEDLSARRLWLCEVRDGRIAEVIGYCSGEWDEELRERHAAEAPMIRL